MSFSIVPYVYTFTTAPDLVPRFEHSDSEQRFSE
jgi:hypothetical protein